MCAENFRFAQNAVIGGAVFLIVGTVIVLNGWGIDDLLYVPDISAIEVKILRSPKFLVKPKAVFFNDLALIQFAVWWKNNEIEHQPFEYFCIIFSTTERYNKC